ncbi:MAG: hypothetical protein C5B56_11850 [Proteobacteria bacterium]|nr:MAG: hypothetical protein C5B56_11850 [Pseudomonadota bacterium]
MIKRSWLYFLSICVALLISTPTFAQQPQTKPNILFVMADDVGWMQVGVYADGQGLAETPNIDSIAKAGARFTDYVAMQSLRKRTKMAPAPQVRLL